MRIILIGIIIAFIGTIGFNMLMENPNIEIGDCYDGYNFSIYF